MAEALFTLPQLITINDRNLADVEVPNFLNNSPFMRTNAATLASHDTLHKWLRYANPTVGFRQPNNGREVQVSVDTMVQTDCQIIDGSFRTDLALVREYNKGGQAGWLNRELARHLDAMMFRLEQQVFQGSGLSVAPALGFDGFPDETTLKTIAGGMVVSAGGSTASSQSSAYLVRSGAQDVEIIMGRSGDIYVGDPTVQEAAGIDQGDGALGTFPAIYTPVTGWFALKIGSTVSSVVRIANIENSFTDDMIFEGIAKFGTGRGPTHLYAGRKSLELLRSSRTATNSSGDPAGMPGTVGGVTIVPTDGINEGGEAVVV